MAKVKCNLPSAPEPTRAYHEHKTYTDIVSVHVEAMVPKVHRHRIFTNAEKSEIFAMRERGLPYSFIARHYDTTSDTIRHIVCRENKKRAESGGTPSTQTEKSN
jgi:hypothetical protein